MVAQAEQGGAQAREAVLGAEVEEVVVLTVVSRLHLCWLVVIVVVAEEGLDFQQGQLQMV